METGLVFHAKHPELSKRKKQTETYGNTIHFEKEQPVSAFYYLGVLVQMYMREPAPAAEGEGGPAPLNLGVAIGAAVLLAAGVTVLLGVWPAPIANLVALIRLG